MTGLQFHANQLQSVTKLEFLLSGGVPKKGGWPPMYELFDWIRLHMSGSLSNSMSDCSAA